MQKPWKVLSTATLVAALSVSMVVPAFAAEGDITNTSTGTVYQAATYNSNTSVYNTLVSSIISEAKPDQFTYSFGAQQFGLDSFSTAVTSLLATPGETPQQAKAAAATTVTPITTSTATVSSVSAVNGTVTTTLSSVPTVTPVPADFVVTQSINGLAATTVAPSLKMYGAVATFSDDIVPATAVDQSVVYSVNYKGQTPKSAAAFVVSAGVNANVGSAAELAAALTNPSVTSITFTASLLASPIITRPLTMNLGAYILTGDVTFNYTGTGTSVLTGNTGTRISGNLTVNTPQASFNNGVKVGGTVNVVNVQVGTWTESADGNTLNITDPDGVVINVTGNPSSVTVATSASSSGSLSLNVNAGGTVNNITSNAPISILVATGATVGSITSAAGSAGSTITNNGTTGSVTAYVQTNIVVGIGATVTNITTAAGSGGSTITDNGTAGTVIANAPTAITVATGATATNITAAAGSVGSTITNNGTTGTVTANVPINLVANVPPANTVVSGSGSVAVTGTDAGSVVVNSGDGGGDYSPPPSNPAQSGSPAFTAGTPATVGTQMTVGAGNLGTRSNLTYTWYRSVNATYEAGTDTQVGTGLTYIPVLNDVGKYLIVVATSSDATGNGTVATGAVAAALSSDAGLATVAGQTITAGGEAGTTGAPKTASISVLNSVATVAAVAIVKTDPGAAVAFYGTDSTFTTTTPGAISLIAGVPTIVYVKVTAADTTALDYAVTINRAAALSSDARLATVAGQTITAGGEAGTIGAPKTASINVANAVTTVAAGDVLRSDGGATVDFYGEDSSFTTTTPGAISLTAGVPTIVYVKVTAADTTALDYAITINRASANTTAVGGAAATQGTSTIAYTLTTGTFDATAGVLTTNWTIAGTNGADLGAITGVVLSAGNTVATVTVTNPIGAFGQVYTVAPAQAAFATGFTAPASAATVLIAAADVTSSDFITTALNNTVTITLTGGTFKTGTIAAGDFTFTGTDAGALAAGTFTRTSDTGVTITGLTLVGGTNNTVVVKGATQATQATSVIAATPVNLGTSGNYVILAEAGISSAGSDAITGDIAVSPIAATAITGFDLSYAAASPYATSSQVIGNVYSPDYADPTPTNLTTAVSNMGTAYTDAAGRAPNHTTELYSGNISGKTLTPGVYKWSNSVLINTDVTLSGGATDVFIFEIAGGITQAANTHVILAGGVQAKNVFWQSVDTVAIDTGAHFEGIVLSSTDITMGTGASINGRMLAQTAVTLGTNCTVTAPPQ